MKSLANNCICILQYNPPPLLSPADPLPVTLLTATILPTSDVQLSWTPSSDSVQNEYRYRYRRQDNNEDWNSGEDTTSTTTSISSLFPGGRYEFEVTAVSGSSESTPSTATVTMCKYVYAEIGASFIEHY